MNELFHKYPNRMHYIIFVICPVGLSWDVDFSISVLGYDVMFCDDACDFGYSKSRGGYIIFGNINVL